ncbi:MAG: hypothetical protein QW094_08095, partial [Candidatus Caldarchaeum sp.]
MRVSLISLLLFAIVLSFPGNAGHGPIPSSAEVSRTASSSGGSFSVYLPVVLQSWGPPVSRQVNAPRLGDPLGNDFPRMAIFWFGKVTPTANYADVRVAYTSSELVVYVAIVDRRL